MFSENKLTETLHNLNNLSKDEYIKYKKDYFENCIEIYDEFGNIVQTDIKKWATKFLYDCTVDKEWEDEKNISLVRLEFIDVIKYFKLCNNKVKLKIFETNNIDNLQNSVNDNSLILMYMKNENGFNKMYEMLNNLQIKAYFSILINDNISNDFQIGVICSTD